MALTLAEELAILHSRNNDPNEDPEALMGEYIGALAAAAIRHEAEIATLKSQMAGLREQNRRLENAVRSGRF